MGDLALLLLLLWLLLLLLLCFCPLETIPLPTEVVSALCLEVELFEEGIVPAATEGLVVASVTCG